MAMAEDSSQPQFWIELGGQLARNQTDLEPYLPSFVLTTPRPAFETISPQSVQKAEPSSWDGNVGIAFLTLHRFRTGCFQRHFYMEKPTATDL